MSLYLDIRYAEMLTPYLERAKKNEQPYKIKFRCPICGDSQSDKKALCGAIMHRDNSDSLMFSCFKCDAKPFWKFLRDVNPAMYENYKAEEKIEWINAKQGIKPPKPEIKPFERKVYQFKHAGHFFKAFKDLPVDHPARVYIEGRKIPCPERFAYCEDFSGFSRAVFPDYKFSFDDPRICLFIRNEAGKIVGVNARTIADKTPKYIVRMFDNAESPIYGMNKVDWSKQYFITEGAIDSLFLTNSIAMGGLKMDFRKLKNKGNAVVILDNQPREPKVAEALIKAVDAGLKVVVWPNSPVGKEDLNDMIKAGKNIDRIIHQNTFSGLAAKMQIKRWKRA